MRRDAKSTRVITIRAVRVSLIPSSHVLEVRPFMPRDNDKNNDSRGRRDRPSGGKGRSGAARGPEKKFAKRSFAEKSEGDKRPHARKSEGGDRSHEKKPYSASGKPYAGKREGASARRDYAAAPRARREP